MSTDYSSSFTPAIAEAQFTGQGGDQVTSPEAQEAPALQAEGIVFDNITFDPTVISSLQTVYNNSFVVIKPPDLTVPQSQQAYISDLTALEKATQDVISQAAQQGDHPLSAQSVLSDIQSALEAAQENYNRYYAPGAPFADEVQGYRFPMQEVSNSMMTVQHIAGLALVQTAATPGSEEQLLSSGPTQGRGLTVAEANYYASKSFLSLLKNSQLQSKSRSLKALRKLLGQFNVLRVRNTIARQKVINNKNINHGPLNVLEAKTEEKNNEARNLAAKLGDKAVSFLQKVTSATQGLLTKASSPNISSAQFGPTATELVTEDDQELKKALATEGIESNPGNNESNTVFQQDHAEHQANVENQNISNNNDVTKNAAPHLKAAFVSESNLSNQPFSYHITGNAAAAVDTSTAIALEHSEVVESAATNVINISPSAMTKELNNSLQQSVNRLNKLVEGRPQNALNVSLR